MSVVVKGMRIPENCWKCMETKLNIAVSVFGGMCPYCEKIRTDHDMQTGRHHECPLGALPDHHGDLIDRDELLKKTWDADTRCGYVQVVDRFDIDNEPTIVEAEGDA